MFTSGPVLDLTIIGASGVSWYGLAVRKTYGEIVSPYPRRRLFHTPVHREKERYTTVLFSCSQVLHSNNMIPHVDKHLVLFLNRSSVAHLSGGSRHALDDAYLHAVVEGCNLETRTLYRGLRQTWCPT